MCNTSEPARIRSRGWRRQWVVEGATNHGTAERGRFHHSHWGSAEEEGIGVYGSNIKRSWIGWIWEVGDCSSSTTNSFSEETASEFGRAAVKWIIDFAKSVQDVIENKIFGGKVWWFLVLKKNELWRLVNEACILHKMLETCWNKDCTLLGPFLRNFQVGSISQGNSSSCE